MGDVGYSGVKAARNDSDWRCRTCRLWHRRTTTRCRGCGAFVMGPWSRKALRERAEEHRIAAILKKYEAPAED